MIELWKAIRDLWTAIKEIRKELGQLVALSRLTYAKGTYVPTYLGATTAGVTTYTTQAGFYTRIGRIVFFNGRVVWTAATGTGAAVVSLPFTPDGTTNMRYSLFARVDGVTFANGSVQGRIAPADPRIFFDSPLTNAASTVINVEAAGTIDFTGWFYV